MPSEVIYSGKWKLPLETIPGTKMCYHHMYVSTSAAAGGRNWVITAYTTDYALDILSEGSLTGSVSLKSSTSGGASWFQQQKHVTSKWSRCRWRRTTGKPGSSLPKERNADRCNQYCYQYCFLGLLKNKYCPRSKVSRKKERHCFPNAAWVFCLSRLNRLRLPRGKHLSGSWAILGKESRLLFIFSFYPLVPFSRVGS